VGYNGVMEEILKTGGQEVGGGGLGGRAALERLGGNVAGIGERLKGVDLSGIGSRVGGLVRIGLAAGVVYAAYRLGLGMMVRGRVGNEGRL
jgi:hypothetical protein